MGERSEEGTCGLGHEVWSNGLVTFHVDPADDDRHGEQPGVETRWAGRSAVAHEPTVMVKGRCPVCGETESEWCQFVVGEQGGETVRCGAVRSLHGDALGMARHEFLAKRTGRADPDDPTMNGQRADFERAIYEPCGEHEGCNYRAVMLTSETTGERRWFCNKCGHVAPVVGSRDGGS